MVVLIFVLSFVRSSAREGDGEAMDCFFFSFLFPLFFLPPLEGGFRRVQLSGWALTVGGGLGLPSESSTFVLVRLASCSSRNARSSRIFSTWRLSRARRSLAASFASSTSLVRCFSWMHFRR